MPSAASFENFVLLLRMLESLHAGAAKTFGSDEL